MNIAYLDSVKLFNPPHLRSAVYHEIILSYLQFVKDIGYMTAHVWVCPPSGGSEYIFYSHPKNQVTLPFDLLLNWYMDVFDKGKAEGIIYKYNNIHDEFILNEKKTTLCLTKLPYFDGDFWPHIIDEKINIPSTNASEHERKVMSQIVSTMKSLKDSFVVIHLHPALSAKDFEVVHSSIS